MIKISSQPRLLSLLRLSARGLFSGSVVSPCRLKRCALFVGALAILLSGFACRERQSDATNPSPPEVKTIENKGSDTLVNLALAWAEEYMRKRPDVRISVTGGGSGTGITALMNGTAHIANASREMKEEEIRAARANGIEPREIVVARDAIAIVVNPSNPVRSLTMQQISDIYTGKITNWREL
ncbi:MAG: hypothetical protein C4576_11005, partial [Desulfobacteraceae bacterium]